MRRVDAKVAKQLIAEKQSVEVGLSLDVQEIFDVEMISDLRAMCQQSIIKVSTMAQSNPAFATDYPKKWSFYGCMKGMAQWDANTLLNHSQSWKTSDCGDWIRVYGEIIEAKKFFSANQEKKRTAPQLGGDKGYWSKPKAPAAEKGQTSGDQGLLQPNLQASALRRRLEFNTLTIHDQGLYGLETTESGFLMKSMMFSGIKKWAIMAEDVTGKVDRVFGLMKGATISGTTTDNIYFLNKFAKAIQDPILYLLPIGSIAGGGHHSLLEVAIPLTMNNLMNYSVGLYSTLIPSGDPPERTPLRQKGADDLKKVCGLWEARPENHLLLCYFEQGQLAGALVGDKNKDRADWLRAFKADESLMDAFAAMAISPTEGQLYNFMRLRQIRWN
jgi:hypothetical protein